MLPPEVETSKGNDKPHQNGVDAVDSATTPTGFALAMTRDQHHQYGSQFSNDTGIPGENYNFDKEDSFLIRKFKGEKKKIKNDFIVENSREVHWECVKPRTALDSEVAVKMTGVKDRFFNCRVNKTS